MDKVVYLLLFTLLWSPKLLAQGSAPPDVLSLELLINSHKKQQDLLKKRNEEEVKHHGISQLVKDISEKYEKLHKEISKRYNNASEWLSLGISAVDILKELNELKKAIPEFISYTRYITNPHILKRYFEAGKELKQEIEFCIKISASIPALRLNAKELTDLSYLIRSRLGSIKYIIRGYMYSIKGHLLASKHYGSPSVIDRIKIANRIIRDINAQVQ